MTLDELIQASEEHRAVFRRPRCLFPTWENPVPASTVLRTIKAGKIEVFLRNLEVSTPSPSTRSRRAKIRGMVRADLRGKKAGGH